MKKLFKKQLDKKTIIKAVGTFAFVALIVYCSIAFLNNTAVDDCLNFVIRLNAKAAECDAQYQQQIKENDEIKAIVNSDNKDDYIEQKAREKGYAKEGETVYYDISSSK